MESTISNQIIEVLNMLCEKFGVAIDWSAQNVLPYVQELMNKVVKYELFTSVAWIMFFVILLVVCLLNIKKISNTPKFNRNDAFEKTAPTFAFLLTIVAGFLTFCLISVGIFQVIDIIACITFPEKIILRMIQYYMM